MIQNNLKTNLQCAQGMAVDVWRDITKQLKRKKKLKQGQSSAALTQLKSSDGTP